MFAALSPSMFCYGCIRPHLSCRIASGRGRGLWARHGRPLSEVSYPLAIGKRAQPQILGEAEQVAIRILDQEFPASGFDLTGPVPVVLDRAEQLPSGVGQSIQQRRQAVHVKLE